MSYEFQQMEELNNVESLNREHQDSVQEITDSHREMRSISGAHAGVLAYGIHKVSDIPAVREKINDCKEALGNAFENAKDSVVEYGTKVSEGIKEYCCGVYENVKDFFTQKELSEGITEGRDFGLDKCTEAALELFNPGVIDQWGNMSLQERKDIACMYADRVAEAFELEIYKGVYIEEMDPGVLGSNNGDGTIHISEKLIGDYTTPFEILDTITHELRHQYQSECIDGYHNVSDEVRNEFAVSSAIYTYDDPTCFDPWGYSYNPCEIDANYAGSTIVRNVSSQIFNDIMNLMA